jgi:RNA polymerase sigma-70 factor, ECF subfamily
MDEIKLVARAKDGDFAAFTELINAHKDKVFALARRLAGNEQDAEDIVQDSLLKAIDKIDSFRGDSSFGTWLYAIALNQSRGHLDRQKQTQLKSIEEYLPPAQDADDSKAEHARLYNWDDPHTRLEADELKKVIDSGLEELPYIYREAFVLRYIEELSVKEVAAIIGESEAATKSRILRARLALRDYLARQFEVKHGTQVS